MAVTIADREQKNKIKAFRICSSESNFSTAKSKFVAFTK